MGTVKGKVYFVLVKVMQNKGKKCRELKKKTMWMTNNVRSKIKTHPPICRHTQWDDKAWQKSSHSVTDFVIKISKNNKFIPTGGKLYVAMVTYHLLGSVQWLEETKDLHLLWRRLGPRSYSWSKCQGHLTSTS